MLWLSNTQSPQGINTLTRIRSKMLPKIFSVWLFFFSYFNYVTCYVWNMYFWPLKLVQKGCFRNECTYLRHSQLFFRNYDHFELGSFILSNLEDKYFFCEFQFWLILLKIKKLLWVKKLLLYKPAQIHQRLVFFSFEHQSQKFVLAKVSRFS